MGSTEWKPHKGRTQDGGSIPPFSTIDPMYCEGFEEDPYGKKTPRTWEYRHTCGGLCWELIGRAYCYRCQFFLWGMPQEWIDTVEKYFEERKENSRGD